MNEFINIFKDSARKNNSVKSYIETVRNLNYNNFITSDFFPGYADGLFDFGYFDKCIMFPSINIYGECMGFIGKTIENKFPPYKFSSNFDKELNVFGLYQGLQSIIKNDYIVIVEGIFDVISSHLHGFNNVVAGPGKSLYNSQISILRRFTKNAILLFDNDSTGINSTNKYKKILEELDFFVNLGEIPKHYKDIDEFLRKDNTYAKKYLQSMFKTLSNT